MASWNGCSNIPIPIFDASLHIMGSKTYADMISWWPYSNETFANPMNSIPKAVFTRRDTAGVRDVKPSQAVNDAAKAAEASGEQKREPDPKVPKEWRDAYIATGPMTEELAKLNSRTASLCLRMVAQALRAA